MWLCGLLRFVREQAHEKTLRADGASPHALDSTGRSVVMVLSRQRISVLASSRSPLRIMSTISPEKDHAVVIGASMAGLLAARVLTDHFARVTLVERDELPDGPLPRKGVPQARHAHILLVRG